MKYFESREKKGGIILNREWVIRKSCMKEVVRN